MVMVSALPPPKLFKVDNVMQDILNTITITALYEGNFTNLILNSI